MQAYVIKSWMVNPQSPDAEGAYVRISGRASGVISWILSILNISPTVQLVVSGQRIAFEQGSISGFEKVLTPLENVCATVYGYYKPWKATLGIIIAWLFILIQIAAAAARDSREGLSGLTLLLLAVVGVAMAVLYYFLNKKLLVGFTDVGGRLSWIRFKPSAIEGHPIDQAAAAHVCDVIQFLVDVARANTRR